MRDADLDALAARIGYQFRRKDLVIRALTHKSHASDTLRPDAPPKSTSSDNEQLEFFGDAILGFLVSEILYEMFPEFPEGKLSKLKSWLVSSSHLHAKAEALNLGKALRLGRGEEMSGGRSKKAILANALEALLAAIYLDGGLEPARVFVQNLILPPEVGIEINFPAALTDFKSALQERAQSLGLAQPKYVIAGEKGPEHAKIFTVEVRVGKTLSARAEGVSKKDAGQRAAERLLEALDQPVTAPPDPL